MGLSVNNNIAAMNSYRNLSITDGQMSKSLEKLSSGFRINRAADDAAGLAISEGLRSQIGGLKVAVRNTQDGVSVVQTAEGALTETHKILQRMRDLTVQASNGGGLNDDAKKNIQSEIGQLKNELTRIQETTTFNGTKLLDSKYDGKFQVGANVGESINVKIGTAMGASGLGVDGVDITKTGVGTVTTTPTTAVAGSAAGSNGTAASATIPSATLDLSKAENFAKLDGSITYNGNTLDLSSISYKADASVADRKTAVETAVNNAFSGKVTVDWATSASGVVFKGETPVGPATTDAEKADLAKKQMTFTQATGAESALKKIDSAIKTVSNTRADLGAIQNRFEHTINNLNVAVENLTASESRIRDTDMAQEMTNFTRSQILTQAGTAMLAQANQVPQGVLSLLR
ncbi:flagellin [Geodermatophilus sp. CPCC 206100]|uniref:flagellin N-terminal helical domain-containing protein n=1 Tax=Geodermatophilus sp. CPCC 206100 TaxID=3020054 RepID=UPI003B00B91B